MIDLHMNEMSIDESIEKRGRERADMNKKNNSIESNFWRIQCIYNALKNEPPEKLTLLVVANEI